MRLPRKSKILSIRLSLDEYHEFRGACESYGSRNVSELARTALRHLLTHDNNGNGPHALTQQLDDLRERLRLLSADVERVAAQLPK